MNKYESILNLSWNPKNHRRMSIKDRAFQFAPYSALSGYEEEVLEAGKLTTKKKELSEDQKSIIDMKLQIIDEHIGEDICINVLYFVMDKTKSGGKYLSYSGIVKRVDSTGRKLIFKDGKPIEIDSILDINIDNLLYT